VQELGEPTLWCPLDPHTPQRSETRMIAGEWTFGLAEAGYPEEFWYVTHDGQTWLLPPDLQHWGPMGVTDSGVVYLWEVHNGESDHWTHGGGMVSMGEGCVQGVSRDGSVAVGYHSDAAPCYVRACWWDASDTRHDLETAGGGGRALAISPDGSLIYGYDRNATGGDFVTCKWVSGSLHSLSGVPIPGKIHIAGDWLLLRPIGQADYQVWYQDVLLPQQPPHHIDDWIDYYRWSDVSSDGIVVGAHHVVTGPSTTIHTAVIWHPDWPAPISLESLVPVEEFAAWQCLDVAYAIDGNIVGGVGRNSDAEWRAFLLRIPEDLAPAE